MPQSDLIIVRDLLVRNIIGVDSWERQKKQDVIINLFMESDVIPAGETDEIGKTISYSAVAKEVAEFAESKQYKSVEGLAEGIANLCLTKMGVKALVVRVAKPRALLLAASAGVEIRRSSVASETEANKNEDKIIISDLLVRTIIGVNPWERDEKQSVMVNLTMWPLAPSEGDYVPKTHNYRTIARTLINFLEASTFQTIEAMVTSVSDLLLLHCHVRKLTLYVEKPSALLLAKSAGIQITREQVSRKTAIAMGEKGSHVAYIALGSNLGDRVKNILGSLKELRSFATILDTSFLYETPAAYVTDQPHFLNAVCKVATKLSPNELLAAVKGIEQTMGRVESFRNGPRSADLDILFFDDVEMKTEALEVPHPRIQEREFVLRPLCDTLKFLTNSITKNLEHPGLMKTSLQLLNHLQTKSAVTKVLPIGNEFWHLGQKTLVMGILNTTPDSFSDGGKYVTLETAVARALEIQNEGASIIDIGGMSTRPGAELIPVEEELQRIIPVIKKLKETAAWKIPISVDTFRSQVAKAAIEAGASMVNDVTGGTGDPEMYKVMAELDVPVCLMHMRGDTKTMMDLKDYENDDIVLGVRKELVERVKKAMEAGVKRWNIVVDPGFGYAKHAHQSIYLLGHLHELMEPGKGLEGFPVLAGPSRKGFIGSILNQPDAEQRTWGTAAACAALVASKSDILRVHDVQEMIDVVKISDAVWRTPSKTH